MEYRKLHQVNLYRRILIVLLVVSINNTISVANITSYDDIASKTDSSGNDTIKYQPLKEIRWSGYVRTFFYYRNLKDKYFDTPGGQQWYSVNGGYNEPFMRLTASGRPTINTSFEVQYTFDNLLTGLGSSNQYGVSGKNSLPLQYLKFAGTATTKYGNFNMQAGGIYFYNMTTFTIGGYSTRNDPFERLPWESATNSQQRYEKYYYEGSERRAYQSRYGSDPIQGFVLEGNTLPCGIGMVALFGKSQRSGGYQSWQNNNPRKLQAYRIYKSFSGQQFGINYMNSFGNTDQYLRKKETNNILTIDTKIKLKEIIITAEGGIGSYVNPILPLKTGGMFNANISTTQKLTFIPIQIHAYQVSPNVVNLNSEMLNSSVRSLSNNSFGDTTQLSYAPGVITDAGQLTNNRRGLDLTLQKDVKGLKIGITLCSSEEIENISNGITFQHRLNKVARSRFSFFTTNAGPYHRLSNIYLTTYETMSIIGLSTQNYKKRFNTLDVNLRYKFRLFRKNILVFNYTDYNSVQKNLSFVPVGISKAFINYLYNETMATISILPSVTLIGLFAYERTVGGQNTELASNGKHLDQTGYGYGTGIDFDIKSRAGIYIRCRHFSHKDVNFTLDKFSGFEASLEFKVFF